jgi:hypothetical protein
MAKGFNFLHQESDNEYMTLEKYAQLVGGQPQLTRESIEANYSEFMFQVAYFCVARALKNLQGQVQLNESQNEIVSSITFDDYMQKRRLKSLFLIPEQSKE